MSLGEEAHLNTSFKHFIYFVQVSVSVEPFSKELPRIKHFQEFELIEKKELAPLTELIERLTSINTSGSHGMIAAAVGVSGGTGSAVTTPTSEGGMPTFQPQQPQS